MTEFYELLERALVGPFNMFADPQSRIHWLFILGSLLLPLVLLRRHAWRRELKKLFSWQIWSHPSSRLDILILLTNYVLRVFLFPSRVLAIAGVAAVVSYSLRQMFSVPQLGLSVAVVTGIFTLVSFVVDDFSRFYLHYLQHKIPFLWRFHRVHHSAEVLTPLSLYRTHPVDMLGSLIRSALAVGFVTGVCFFLFGDSLSGWDIIGANAFGFLFNLLGANLRHSHVWLHFGALESVFISPAAHQVHHSIDPRHYDRNFGSCFALWDRWFGSFVDPRPLRQKDIKFGLVESNSRWSFKRVYWDLWFGR
ncbi:MAG: sterol desaturase family protein [Pseudobacteriovorax sp.]|nr:sterol desaturase family protein [Pseudobacteriovorax sp.]